GEASALAEAGRFEEADALFASALAAYRDVSPFPVCWIAFQRATLWLRAGERERARAFLVEVVERLPRHVPATVDLGWLDFRLGRRAEGIARLRSATGSEDPEAAALLAQALADAGSAAEAESWRRRAAERYDALVAAHPEAYADHASRFWLGAG